MIRLFARLWIPDRRNFTSPAVRQAYGMLCGAVGILLNIILFAGKLFAGLLTGSIAVTADAFNNLSDAGSSAVTLLGFRLSGQKPDPQHPFGHGRIEYISGLVVAMMILLMGFELGKTSVERLFAPVAVSAETLALVILGASILVKFYMYLYNRAIGRKIESAAVLAAAADSLSDTAATAVVLLTTILGKFVSLPLDSIGGLMVACFILYSGIGAAKDTISPLLGQPPEPEFVKHIEQLVMSYPAVRGIHDLVVHDYGPGRRMISLHAEVSCNADLLETHDTIDNIEQRLRNELGCDAVIHMDPIATDDVLTTETHKKIAELVKIIDDSITIHDFRMVVGPTHTNLIFDAVVPFAFRLSDTQVTSDITRIVKSIDENYNAVINIDHSYVGTN